MHFKLGQPIELKRSWLIAMNGASLAEIAEVLGHKTLAMVKRYAHLSDGHVSNVVASMNNKIFNNGVEIKYCDNIKHRLFWLNKKSLP